MLRVTFLTLLLLAVSASATVLVYEGQGKGSLPPTTSTLSKQPRLYAIYDTTTRDLQMVFYFKLAGKKTQQPNFPLANTRYASLSLPDNKKVGTLSAVFDGGLSGSEFVYQMFYARGPEKSLLVANLGGNQLANYPKTLTGFYRLTTFVAGNANDVSIDFALTFQAIPTQIANNQFKTGQQTRDDIIAQLTQKGFE